MAPDPAAFIARIIPESRRQKIAEHALENFLRPTLNIGKAGSVIIGDIVQETYNDPVIRRKAVELIKMGLIEAAYRFGGRLGGKAVEKIAEALAEATLNKLGIEHNIKSQLENAADPLKGEICASSDEIISSSIKSSDATSVVNSKL